MSLLNAGKKRVQFKQVPAGNATKQRRVQAEACDKEDDVIDQLYDKACGLLVNLKK